MAVPVAFPGGFAMDWTMAFHDRGTAALPIDDHAAREWQRRGVSFNVPPPTFARDDFRWTLRQADGADGTVLKHDPETGQWVPVDYN